MEPYAFTEQRIRRIEEEGLRCKHLYGMHLAHGNLPNHKCGECVSFLTRYPRPGAKVFKCGLVGTQGPETDWRKSWQACGKFRERITTIKARERDDG